MKAALADGSATGRAQVVLTGLGAVIGAGAAAFTAAELAEEGSGRLAVVAPIAMCALALVALLALTRFAGYVYLMLLVRASIDVTRFTGDSPLARLLTPSTVLAVLFIGAAALWLTAQYRAGRLLPGSGLRRALIVFLCAALISLAGGVPNPSYGLSNVLRVLAVAMMFAVLEQLMTDRQGLRRYMTAVYLSVVFPLLYTTAGYATGNPPVEVKGGIERVIGTFTQSNVFGRYLMLLVIVGVAMHPHVRGRLRIAFAAVLGLCFAYLTLTYTLTAIAGAALGLAVVGIKQSKRLLVALLVAMPFALLSLTPLSARLAAITGADPYAGAGSHGGNTLAWRLDYWAQLLPLANDTPLTGIGFGMTPFVTKLGAAPHNDYLRTYVETGAVGLVAYVALMVMLIRTGVLASRAAPEGSPERSLAVGYLGCAVSVAVASAASNMITDVVQLWYLLAFAAAASAILRQYGGKDAAVEGATSRGVPT